VGIDEAGKNRGFAKIADFCLGWDLIRSDDVQDAVSFDEQGGWTHGGRRYNPAGNEGAQIHSEKRNRRKSRENS